jgi:hypothetical protein
MGGLSGRAEAQWRPRVSKLREKGLSNYHSSETVVEASRQGSVGQIKDYSQDIFTKKGRAEKQLFARQKKGKMQSAREKTPRRKKKDRLL